MRHYPTAEPSAFRQVHVLIKETDASAWIRVIEAEEALARPDVSVQSYPADPSILADPSGRPTAGLDVFPVAIGYYQDPGFEELDVDTQVGRLVDLLARFGGRAREWPVPARHRGAGQVAQRLRHWSHFGEEATAPANTVLYWVGHGWSDGTDSVLAHADSPFIVADDGVRPISLARAVQVRQRWANDYADPAVEDAWALVIIDACRAGAFAKQIPLGAPVCALLQHPAANQSADRAGDDATITVGLHTGIVTMNLSHALLTGPRNSGT